MRNIGENTLLSKTEELRSAIRKFDSTIYYVAIGSKTSLNFGVRENEKHSVAYVMVVDHVHWGAPTKGSSGLVDTQG